MGHPPNDDRLYLSSVASCTGHRLPISDESERAIPSAGGRHQEPEIQVVWLGRNGGRHAHNGLEVPVHAIAKEVALEEGDAARRGPHLLRGNRVAEISQVVPGERRVVVVSKILLDHAPVWHQQIGRASCRESVLVPSGVGGLIEDGLYSVERA